MRIQSSDVTMVSRHALSIEHRKSERLEAWVDAPAPTSAPEVPASQEAPSLEPSPLDRLKIDLIVRLLEAFTGKEVSIRVPEGLQDPKEAQEASQKLDSLAQNAQGARLRQGWGIRYDYHERYQEVESSAFNAEGKIRTADGMEIAFSVRVTMSRSFLREESLQFRAGDAPLKDPLVINFEGPAAALTQTKFRFDLDADGEEDQISFLMPGSGFLALDANGDGVINDGREVFGAISGDAYADLAAYDEDGNGWLDEGDSIFSRLRIWTKDAHGNDQLFALGEKGIGALYLGAIATPFSLKDSENGLHGQVRRSGVFLFEDGRAGTMQQIDLAV